VGGVYAYVMQSKLPATLINLAYLRVSQLERKGARKRSKLKSEIGRARYRARRV
jgi:hypothetical protein